MWHCTKTGEAEAERLITGPQKACRHCSHPLPIPGLAASASRRGEHRPAAVTQFRWWVQLTPASIYQLQFFLWLLVPPHASTEGFRGPVSLGCFAAIKTPQSSLIKFISRPKQLCEARKAPTPPLWHILLTLCQLCRTTRISHNAFHWTACSCTVLSHFAEEGSVCVKPVCCGYWQDTEWTYFRPWSSRKAHQASHQIFCVASEWGMNIPTRNSSGPSSKLLGRCAESFQSVGNFRWGSQLCRYQNVAIAGWKKLPAGKRFQGSAVSVSVSLRVLFRAGKAPVCPGKRRVGIHARRPWVRLKTCQ